MTAARPRRKTWIRTLRQAGLGLAVAAGLAVPDATAGTTDRVVADWLTGLALSGFDPVAYFTDAAPKTGRPEHEYSFGGAT